VCVVRPDHKKLFSRLALLNRNLTESATNRRTGMAHTAPAIAGARPSTLLTPLVAAAGPW
jgi:DNA-binding transcriptional regulator YdaS (Cro superfamily)